MRGLRRSATSSMLNGFQSIWHRLTPAEPATADHFPTGRFSVSGAPGDTAWKMGSNRRRYDQVRSNAVHHFGRWGQVSYLLIDLIILCTDGIIAFWLRFFAHTPDRLFHLQSASAELHLRPVNYAAFLMLYAAVIVLSCQSQGLYRTVRMRTAFEECFAVFKAVLLGTLLLCAFIYFSGVRIVSRLVVTYAGGLNVVMFICWRLWKRKIVVRRVRRGTGTRNVLIVGAGRVGRALAAYLDENKVLGYSFKGFLDSNHTTDPRLLGKIEDLRQVAHAQFADEVFISIPSEREVVKNVAAEARRHGLSVKVVPDLYDGFGWRAPISHIGQFPVMELHCVPIPAVGLFLKRMIDIVGSVLGLVLLSPVLALTAVCVRLDSAGPAIYSSTRVGRKGRKFTCYKFRTMVKDADATKEQLQHLNERQGPFFKISNDPRVTRLGRLLRRYSLDELPQLWNVFKGEMSLVGPRPPVPDECEDYRPEQLRRLQVKPGITGLWQIIAREDPSFDKTLFLDVEYINNWTLWLDLKILFKTLPVACSGTGA